MEASKICLWLERTTEKNIHLFRFFFFKIFLYWKSVNIFQISFSIPLVSILSSQSVARSVSNHSEIKARGWKQQREKERSFVFFKLGPEAAAQWFQFTICACIRRKVRIKICSKQRITSVRFKPFPPLHLIVSLAGGKQRYVKAYSLFWFFFLFFSIRGLIRA